MLPHRSGKASVSTATAPVIRARARAMVSFPTPGKAGYRVVFSMHVPYAQGLLVARPEVRDRRVQSPAGDQQQREAGTGLLKVDANGAFLVEGRGRSLPSLLCKHARR